MRDSRFYCDEDSSRGLVGCDAVQRCSRIPNFPRTTLPPSLAWEEQGLPKRRYLTATLHGAPTQVSQVAAFQTVPSCHPTLPNHSPPNTKLHRSVEVVLTSRRPELSLSRVVLRLFYRVHVTHRNKRARANWLTPAQPHYNSSPVLRLL